MYKLPEGSLLKCIREEGSNRLVLVYDDDYEIQLVNKSLITHNVAEQLYELLTNVPELIEYFDYIRKLHRNEMSFNAAFDPFLTDEYKSLIDGYTEKLINDGEFVLYPTELAKKYKKSTTKYISLDEDDVRRLILAGYRTKIPHLLYLCKVSSNDIYVQQTYQIKLRHLLADLIYDVPSSADPSKTILDLLYNIVSRRLRHNLKPMTMVELMKFISFAIGTDHNILVLQILTKIISMILPLIKPGNKNIVAFIVSTIDYTIKNTIKSIYKITHLYFDVQLDTIVDEETYSELVALREVIINKATAQLSENLINAFTLSQNNIALMNHIVKPMITKYLHYPKDASMFVGHIALTYMVLHNTHTCPLIQKLLASKILSYKERSKELKNTIQSLIKLPEQLTQFYQQQQLINIVSNAVFDLYNYIYEDMSFNCYEPKLDRLVDDFIDYITNLLTGRYDEPMSQIFISVFDSHEGGIFENV